MNKVTIDRELLERLLYVMDNYVTHETPEEDQLRAILAAPVQGVNTQLLEALEELMYARTDKAEALATAAIAAARQEGGKV